ncbi:hypothetical protein DFH09DRAFT_95284 [Mycena vulgaris]|nr:hypothetical protein DFH09DRAFT_95284 [Mycena vulgaris]
MVRRNPSLRPSRSPPLDPVTASRFRRLHLLTAHRARSPPLDPLTASRFRRLHLLTARRARSPPLDPLTASSVSASGPINSQSVSASAPDGPSQSVSASGPVDSQSVSASAPVFPSGPASNSASVSVSVTTDFSVSASTTTVFASVASDLTFILTESTLALASLTTTSSLSLSNPDAPTTTFSLTAGAAATALTTAPLPTGLPSRIYPPSGPIENPGGNYSFISLLFDGYLDWDFVCTSSVSSTQLFAMMPLILATAIGSSSDEIKTFALQVRIPDSYTGPADINLLQTLFLAYIPVDKVDALQLQLKSRNSLFYNGVPNDVATALASHVVSAFALNSVADPNPGDSNTSSQSSTGAISQSKTRQDAIIGVVTALGVIAVLVLIFLAVRAFRRRAELAHRRLSDPPEMAAGARPDGREFDQDSVGGQRRRSFYFAEDSLRGFQGERPEDAAQYDSRSPNPGMMQRRNVMPAAISAPILQQSSMNW